MAFVVLLTTMSFTVDMHYCGDSLVDFSIFTEAESCGMEKAQPTESCDNPSMTEKDCCTDQQLVKEGNQDLKISFDKLTKEEQEEHNVKSEKIYKKLNEKPELSKLFEFKFYKMPNGRNASGLMYLFNKVKTEVEKQALNKDGAVSFLVIDKVPTFPGCEEGNKKCFSKKVQIHFVKNFNSELPKTLGLSSGRKRIFIGFKIDKKGDVVDIKARAPHPDIKEEVIRVMQSLPRMIPGENNGKKVDVKYSIPFTIFIPEKDK